MKKIKLIRELEEYPVFDLKTVQTIIKKSRNYTKLVLSRLKKEGLIFKILKNKYTTCKEAFVVASNITWPCYLSFWTALRYYNLTEQLPTAIFVITTRAGKKEIIFNKTRIIFAKVKPNYFFGFTKEKYNSFDIFMADPEKAIIDSVLFRKISFSEISSIFKNNLNKINKKKFIGYLLRIKNKALIKRFGFLLDNFNLDISDKVKDYVCDYNYVPLDYAIEKKGKKNKKWKIIENVKL